MVRGRAISRFFTRQNVRRLTVTFAALLCLVGVIGYWLLFMRVSNGGLTFANDLQIPSQLWGEEIDGRLRYQLAVMDGAVSFLPNAKTNTLGVNGGYLGPTIRVRRGDEIDLVVENRLDEVTTMHWHGMHVPAAMDGTPHQPIEPGETWTASFEVDQQAATLWYHPHPHGNTGWQAYRGISGMFWIDDANSESLDLPNTYGVDDIPIILQDRLFDDKGKFQFVRTRGAVYGDTILVNGTWNPKLTVEARRIRLRLLNGSNARIYYLGFDDGRVFHQIATDGGFLESAIETRRVVLAPGERAEILVDFSDGREVVLRSFPEAGLLQTAESFFDGAGSGHLDLLKIEPKKSTRASHAIPKSLNTIPRPDPSLAQKTRQMVLGGPGRQPQQQQRGNRGGGGPGFARGIPINGKTMDMHRIDEVVRLGDVEIWELTNRTGQPHPFHMHLVQFQVVDRNGRSPAGAELGWKDTVLVHPGDRVRIMMPFQRYADPQVPYMYHCHIMEHEDDGMMGQFLVVTEPEQRELVQGQVSVVVFIAGLACNHCYQQIVLFDRELRDADVNLLVVTPDRELDRERADAIKSPIVSDPDKRWAGWFGQIHSGPTHGTLLVDRDGEIVWQAPGAEPYMDVEALLERANRLR